MRPGLTNVRRFHLESIVAYTGLKSEPIYRIGKNKQTDRIYLTMYLNSTLIYPNISFERDLILTNNKAHKRFSSKKKKKIIEILNRLDSLWPRLRKFQILCICFHFNRVFFPDNILI